MKKETKNTKKLWNNGKLTIKNGKKNTETLKNQRPKKNRNSRNLKQKKKDSKKRKKNKKKMKKKMKSPKNSPQNPKPKNEAKKKINLIIIRLKIFFI